MVNIDLLLAGVLAVAILLILFPGIPLMMYIYRQKIELDIYRHESEQNTVVSDADIKQIEYSERTLEYYNKLISSIAVTTFQEWMDNRNKDKITRSQFQDLVKKCSESVFKAIEYNKIRSDILLYTDAFYTQYIVHVTIHTMKRILEEKYIEIIEQ